MFEDKNTLGFLIFLQFDHTLWKSDLDQELHLT